MIIQKQIKSYKDLEAYKKAYDLVKAIYKITEDFPKAEIYGITSQIRRSAVSIPTNIAEGNVRGSKEYIHFLKIALGSCVELETLLSLSKDLGFCAEKDFSQLFELNLEIRKLLSTYIVRIAEHYLSNAVH